MNLAVHQEFLRICHKLFITKSIFKSSAIFLADSMLFVVIDISLKLKKSNWLKFIEFIKKII